MNTEKPLVDKNYTIKKMDGKGGWSYVIIEEIPPSTNRKFGMLRVKGSIDSFEFKQYNLMPMGNGNLFLPIKAEIRKKIKKQEGDTVHIILYLDESPVELTEELIECFELYPNALEKYNQLTDSEKKRYLDWIYSAKHDETKANRIIKMMEGLNG